MWRMSVMRLVATGCLLAGVPATGLARPFQDPAPAADAGQFFDDRTVADIHLTMAARDWDTLREHYLESTDYPVAFEWNGITVGNSTVRSRGSGSRNPQKPGLRVDFDRINKSQRGSGGWMGREILREYRQIREFALADPVKPVTNDEFDAAIQSLLQFAADRPAFVRAEVARARAAE